MDELYESINAEEAAAAATERRPPRRIIRYDFKRPDKFSKEQLLTMRSVHETFARLATTSLSAAAGTLVHVHVAAVDQLTYEEFIASIPAQPTLAVCGMDPLKGSVLLEIDPSVTFSIIERLLGGSSAGDGSAIARDLTDLEVSIIESVILRALGNLKEAWTPLLNLRPTLAQIETNPQFAQIVPPREMIILVSLETKIGNAAGMMNLCIPFLTIEPIIGKLSARYWYSQVRRNTTGETAQALAEKIESFDVPVEVLTEGEKLSLERLGSLKKGSLVRVPGLERGEAAFRMGGKILFRMRELPRRGWKPKVYGLLDKPREENLPRLPGVEAEAQSAELYSGIRKVFEEFGSGIGASLSGIAKGITALLEKQDEMTDQLALSPSAQGALEAPMAGERERPFDFARKADPDHILNFLSQERPQLIALVLSYLEPQTASSLLGRLPLEIQSDVAARIARIGRIMPEIVREVERVLEKKLAAISSEAYAEAGGIDGIVEILNISDRTTERHVVESLEKENPELAEEIKKRMFVFEDIVLLDRAAVAVIVKRSDEELFLRAMKSVEEKVKDLIWACLPKEDAERLKKSLSGMGRLRLSDVDAAQQRIVALIREMEELGEIVVSRPSETVE
jgi:flagellar motor switch protein FliM